MEQAEVEKDPFSEYLEDQLDFILPSQSPPSPTLAEVKAMAAGVSE